MRKSMFVVLFCFSCGVKQNKKNTLIAPSYYTNNDAEFYFDSKGAFTFYDYSIYRSDVNIIFCNEWSKGYWKIENDSIILNSQINNPIKIEITVMNDKQKNNLNIDFKGFKENYTLLLINKENNDSFKVDLNNPNLNTAYGTYFFKILPVKVNLSRSMTINNEYYDSESFIIDKDQNYKITINFSQNTFAYRTFINFKLKIKKDKILIDNYKFKKQPENYNSKLSNYY